MLLFIPNRKCQVSVEVKRGILDIETCSYYVMIVVALELSVSCFDNSRANNN
jgi:hypothetical protein